MENNEILLKTAEKEINILKESLKTIRARDKEEIRKLKSENEELRNDNKAMREQLDSILYSRSYKFVQKLKKIIKK